LAAIMKITHVLPWLVRTSGSFWGEYLFVEVRTDAGLSGWGEVTTTTPTANRAVVAMLRQAGTLLHGEDPSRIEAIWHRVFRSFTYLGTRRATSHAVSGIDIALWDLRGRALGLPVYELLGGKLRDDVLLYTHPLGGSHRHDDDLVRETRHCRFGAYRAQDRPVPASSRKSPANDDFLDGNLDREAEREAVRLCRALEDAARLDWFEEPVPVESVDALAEVRESVNAPISVGERLHTRWEFALVLQRRLADYVMPDVTWTGGITELRKIASLAETYSVPVSPHDAGGRSMSLRGRT
jgi:galactonate dehydratase